MNYSNYFFSLIIVFLLFSCKQKEEQSLAINPLTITADTDVNLKLTTIENIGMLNLQDTSAVVTKNHPFTLDKKPNGLTLCFLLADKEQSIFYIDSEKHRNIAITKIDSSKISINFDKEDEINKFTIAFHKQLKPLFQSELAPEPLSKFLSTKEADFLSQLKKLESSITPTAYNTLKSMINGKIAHLKFIHSDRFDTLPATDGYYDFVDTIDFDDTYLTYSDNLNTVLGVVAIQYERKFNKPFEEASAESKLSFVNDVIQNKEIKSAIIAFLASKIIPEQTKESKNELLAQLSNTNIKKDYLDYITKIQASTAIGQKQGNKAQYFETLTPYNKNFSFEQLKGKIVFIDNWATWCGPCMKSHKVFEEKFESLKKIKDIVYVFVSFDRSEEIWRNSVSKFGVSDATIVHLYNGKAMDSPYGKFYNISSLPSYMVIDKQGLVFDTNPKKPTDDDFELYLKKLQ